MPDYLRKLYSTLCLIEVKGESAKIMADCLRYVENLIKTAQNAANDTGKD